jgi:diguanylate cyclase (GGDEF)-like protein
MPRQSDTSAPPTGNDSQLRRGGSDSYHRLAAVFHHVLSEESLDEFLDRIADALEELIPHDALTIYRADEAHELLVPVLARDMWASEILKTRIAFGAGITGSAVERRQPILVHEAHLDARASVIPGTPPDEPEALISVPLIARGRIKGALNVYRLGDGESFTEEEFELATRFGDAAALALDNAETRARLEYQAQTDSLTGLFNHRQFHDRLRAEVGRAARSGEPVAVLMLDLDDFKRVNDVFGHATGDQVLVRVAEILAAAARVSDVVCRVGGEEFGLILPRCDASSARAFARRLSGLLSSATFEPAGRLSVSIGIALAPEHAMNPRELAAFAEGAMMTAKALGKGRTVVFGEEVGLRPQSPPVIDRDARSIAHLRMLQSLVGKLNRLTGVSEIGETILRELRTLIDYHNCRVYLRDGADLIPIAFRGEIGDYGDESAEVLACKVGEGITGRVAETGRPLLLPNALDCDFAVQIPGTPEIQESIVAVPLRYSEHVIGVIVISKLGVEQFDDADLRLLEVLAGHASIALENARLYEAERRETKRARESAEIAGSLLELTRVLAEADSLEDVLRRLAAFSASILGAPRASIWLQESLAEPLSLRAEFGHTEDERALIRDLRIDPDRLRMTVEPERPVVLESADLVEHLGTPPAGWGRSAVATLRLDTGSVGLVGVNWAESAEPELTERRILLLAGIADQATLAIGNAGNIDRLEKTFLSTVQTLTNALDANDEYASCHARSLTDMALRVGEALGLDGKALKRLELGALFHDIGKIGIPSEILAKRGPLTPGERAAIELHPTLGEQILAPIERLAEVRPIVRHCHERWNGTGYPDRLAGNEIPLESRIIFICDSFHAITTDRPYRRRLSREEAFRRLKEAAGTQFDPDLVDVFVRIFDC